MNKTINMNEKNSMDDVLVNIVENLNQEEKRIKFQLMLNKKSCQCLEEAFEWLKVTYEKYIEYRQMYNAYCYTFSVGKAAKSYPLLTSLLLIYTAVYRYNEDDSKGGLWPEFFCNSDYNYQRDVPPVMAALKHVTSNYKIKTNNRNYLEKVNLASVFSQIYIPDVSIRKIYSAIYLCYFKGFQNKCVFNLNELIETYSYKLDKPGIFFLTEDTLIQEAFEKMIDLFVNHLDDQTYIAENSDLPIRFISMFLEWLNKEKSEIDNKKEEYHLKSPKIYFDVLNQDIILKLPVQHSKIYSDEEWGWKIKIDDQVGKFIDAQIIKKKEGYYLALNEELTMKYFNNLLISYVYKAHAQRTWKFQNVNDFILFDECGYFYTSNKLRRSRCIIGGKKIIVENKEYIIEKYVFKEWNGYTFYYMNFEDCQDSKIELIKNQRRISIEIDDHPIMKRIGNHMGFDREKNEDLGNGMLPVYDLIGQYVFFAPNLKSSDFNIVLKNKKDEYKSNQNNLLKINNKAINQITVGFFEDRMPKGRYYLTIRYKNKMFHREEFVFIDRIQITDEFNMEYGFSINKHRKLVIPINSCFKVIPTHANTLVFCDENQYMLETQNDAIVQFGIKFDEKDVILVEKVVLPIKWSLIGLENILDTDITNRMIEITRAAFDNNSIRLQIENFDYHYEALTYKIIITDPFNEEAIEIIKKVVYGDHFHLNFSEIKDRLIQCFNMTVKLQVISDINRILYDNVLFGVVGKIKMLDCVTKKEDDYLVMKWKEKQENKSRILRFFNYQAPWNKPDSFMLQDGVMEIKLNLKKYEKGCYVPIIDYKKEKSLFDQIIVDKKFFKKQEIINKIVNKSGFPPSKQNAILSRIIHRYLNKRLSEVDKIIFENSEENYNAKNVFLTMIQMFYFIEKKDYEQINFFLSHTFKMIRAFLNPLDMDEYLKLLIESRDEFSTENFNMLQRMLLSSINKRYYSNWSIDILARYDAIGALCGVKNGSGVLTDNLKTKIVDSFDLEVLQATRQGVRLMEMVENEIKIINEFWNWLYYSHKNNYILKYNYTLDRAFRIYEYENGIITKRIDGNTIDALIQSIRCKETYNCTIFPENWTENLGVDQDVFYEFKNLLKLDMDSSYMELLKCAFLSVLLDTDISDMDYYSMMVRMQLGNQSDLFKRYRAYFKLIFI